MADIQRTTSPAFSVLHITPVSPHPEQLRGTGCEGCGQSIAASPFCCFFLLTTELPAPAQVLSVGYSSLRNIHLLPCRAFMACSMSSCSARYFSSLSFSSSHLGVLCAVSSSFFSLLLFPSSIFCPFLDIFSQRHHPLG